MKICLRKILYTIGISIIFPGEHSVQGLRKYAIEFFQRQSKGILHIGASTGEEAPEYHRLNLPVLWIEADPETFEGLKVRLKRFPDQKAVNILLSDRDAEVDFFVTDNSGLSSSVHPLTSKGRQNFNIKNIQSKRLSANRMDSIKNIDFGVHDFWIIDVQGHELQVLKGAELTLKHAKWILIEISTLVFYENQSVFHEVHKWLVNQGFVLLYKPNSTHCEALYKRLDVVAIVT